MEPGAHPSVLQGVGDRHDGHALMMGHDGADDRDALVLRKARRSEIEGFVEAVATARSHGGEARVVRSRPLRVDHGRETRRIGRDHDVLGEAALQAETRNAKIGILVGEFRIAGVVGGFRDTPWNPERSPVGLLALHHQATGLLEQAAGGSPHDQRRHQVLEHGAGPGD